MQASPPSLAMGIHGLLAEDLKSTSKAVYMSGSVPHKLKNSHQRHTQTPRSITASFHPRQLRLPAGRRCPSQPRKPPSRTATRLSVNSHSHQVEDSEDERCRRGRREKVIARYDAATGKCFVLSRTMTMQPRVMSGSADLELQDSGTVLNYLHRVGRRACNVLQVYLSRKA